MVRVVFFLSFVHTGVEEQRSRSSAAQKGRLFSFYLFVSISFYFLSPLFLPICSLYLTRLYPVIIPHTQIKTCTICHIYHKLRTTSSFLHQLRLASSPHSFGSTDRFVICLATFVRRPLAMSGPQRRTTGRNTLSEVHGTEKRMGRSSLLPGTLFPLSLSRRHFALNSFLHG